MLSLWSGFLPEPMAKVEIISVNKVFETKKLQKKASFSNETRLKAPSEHEIVLAYSTGDVNIVTISLIASVMRFN